MKYVLVIDDSLTVRTSVEYTIKDLGYSVKQAEDGVDALKKIDTGKSAGDEIVLCICDINMPVMDGITFIKEFRKDDKFTPILVLTTESEKSTIESGKQAGASGWLIKPFKAEQLIEVIKKIIK